jgi:hypothetical protein
MTTWETERRRETNVKTDMQEIVFDIWTGSSWLRREKGGRQL